MNKRTLSMVSVQQEGKKTKVDFFLLNHGLLKLLILKKKKKKKSYNNIFLRVKNLPQLMF